MLGKEAPLVTLSGHCAQLQKHLPPVDTVEATAKAKNGALGTISLSFGTTMKGSEWTVAGEKGVVSVSGKNVTVNGETKEIQDEGNGVKPEVRKWGEALVSGKPNARQSPEEALADLELIEAMLRSGEQDGKAIMLECQDLQS